MSNTFPSWSEFLDALKPAEALQRLTLTPDDEQLRAELQQQFLANLASAYFIYFQSTADHPDWAPLPGSVFLAQPNPDDIYLRAPLRGDRTYRIIGERGSTLLMTLGVKQGLIGTIDPPHPLLNLYNVDDLSLDRNGRFEIILSRERASGLTGDWLYLHPKATMIQARMRSYDWENERDGRVCIECLDGPLLKPMPDRAEIAERMKELSRYVERFSRTWLNYHRDLQRRGLVNKLEFTGFSELGGLGQDLADGGVVQHYWHGLFELQPREALILETQAPKACKYWNVQLNDLLFNTIDYINRQSSLNGHQARVDPDGRFRAVLSAEDPGVPNWLDTNGFLKGTVIGRWFMSSSSPLPTLMRVPLSQVERHLPKGTPRVSPKEREEILRRRRRAVQMRRRW